MTARRGREGGLMRRRVRRPRPLLDAPLEPQCRTKETEAAREA
jgi:hypothetical protein